MHANSFKQEVYRQALSNYRMHSHTLLVDAFV